MVWLHRCHDRLAPRETLDIRSLSLFAFHLEALGLPTRGTARRYGGTRRASGATRDGDALRMNGGRPAPRARVRPDFRTRRADMQTCVQHLAEEAAAPVSG